MYEVGGVETQGKVPLYLRGLRYIICIPIPAKIF